MSSAVQAAVHWISFPLSTAADAVSDFASGVANSGELASENRRLKVLARSADLYGDRVRFLESEIERQRKLFGLESPAGRKRIPARNIEYFPLENRITLNVGQAQDVKAGLPVVASDGLVGIVQTVSKSTCQVLLITSPRMKVGALVLRDTQPAGLVHGESATSLSLEFLDLNSPVKVGDVVVTSGFSEWIPAGIPIGRIVQVQDDIEYGARRCQVFPNVQIGATREVLVLR